MGTEAGYKAARTYVFFDPIVESSRSLNELNLKVSLDPFGQVKRVTGIPPHIENECLCAKMLRLCEETLATVRELMIQVKSAVNEAFEEKAVENGLLTGERLKEILSDYQETLLSVIDERITDLV